MSINTCTICAEDNLDYEGCFNCKSMSECINCCGCLEGEADTCTRCESRVESDMLVTYGDWRLCEICEGDI